MLLMNNLDKLHLAISFLKLKSALKRVNCDGKRGTCKYLLK